MPGAEDDLDEGDGLGAAGAYVVVYVILQVVSQVYFRRSGLMALPGFAYSRRKTL